MVEMAILWGESGVVVVVVDDDDEDDRDDDDGLLLCCWRWSGQRRNVFIVFGVVAGPHWYRPLRLVLRFICRFDA